MAYTPLVQCFLTWMPNSAVTKLKCKGFHGPGPKPIWDGFGLTDRKPQACPPIQLIKSLVVPAWLTKWAGSSLTLRRVLGLSQIQACLCKVGLGVNMPQPGLTRPMNTSLPKRPSSRVRLAESSRIWLSYKKKLSRPRCKCTTVSLIIWSNPPTSVAAWQATLACQLPTYT